MQWVLRGKDGIWGGLKVLWFRGSLLQGDLDSPSIPAGAKATRDLKNC